MRRWIGLALFVLPLAVSAQAKGYGDVSYAKPPDCSVITEQNKGNPYAYLFRDYCERSDARLKQQIARIYGRCALSRLLPRYPSGCELACPLLADSSLTALARQWMDRSRFDQSWS